MLYLLPVASWLDYKYKYKINIHRIIFKIILTRFSSWEEVLVVSWEQLEVVLFHLDYHFVVVAILEALVLVLSQVSEVQTVLVV